MLPWPGDVVGSAEHFQRCRWDMEVPFSIFHIGDVGVGVVGRGRGRYLAGRVCVCV
jgi:hypothetical protein